MSRRPTSRRIAAKPTDPNTNTARIAQLEASFESRINALFAGANRRIHELYPVKCRELRHQAEHARAAVTSWERDVLEPTFAARVANSDWHHVSQCLNELDKQIKNWELDKPLDWPREALIAPRPFPGAADNWFETVVPGYARKAESRIDSRLEKALWHAKHDAEKLLRAAADWQTRALKIKREYTQVLRSQPNALPLSSSATIPPFAGLPGQQSMNTPPPFAATHSHVSTPYQSTHYWPGMGDASSEAMLFLPAASQPNFGMAVPQVSHPYNALAQYNNNLGGGPTLPAMSPSFNVDESFGLLQHDMAPMYGNNSHFSQQHFSPYMVNTGERLQPQAVFQPEHQQQQHQLQAPGQQSQLESEHFAWPDASSNGYHLDGSASGGQWQE
ncbi:hypothetical protein JCM10908_006619 [Rhodotorula pacifica]|uniref:uncharacterized protein n=1 Tax=Rhodotorula pacifica TaxID=1495444 RepID=UPI00316D4D38